MNASILIVDDEESILKGLKMSLEGKYRVITAQTGTLAIQLFHLERPELIMLDIGLPDMNGLEVLKTIKHKDHDAIIIMVTAVEDTKSIVKSIKLGAYDYLTKPINTQELFLTTQNALNNKRLKDQIRIIQKPDIEQYRFKMIGQNPKIKKIAALTKNVSRSVDTPILIVGESGSGKGVLARTIHYEAQKMPGPFITVNCGAIAKDLFESELFGYERGAFSGALADGKKGLFEESADGTLFLDEIGVMSLHIQAKLLGVLEDRSFYSVGGTKKKFVSSRIIAATNIDLEKAVLQGLFRNDLFYRLNVVKIIMPPLRERKDDIILLTRYFMAEYNDKFGKHFSKIPPKSKKILLQYTWPGNIRELQNIIERIILLENDDVIAPEYLAGISEMPDKLPHDGAGFNIRNVGLDYEQTARALFKEALSRSMGNMIEAAKLLNMPVHKLRYRIKKLGLKF